MSKEILLVAEAVSNEKALPREKIFSSKMMMGPLVGADRVQ